MELLLEEAIARIDTNGINAGEINMNSRILEAYLVIREAELVMEGLFNEELADNLDEEWKKKVETTLLTTKACILKRYILNQMMMLLIRKQTIFC